MRRRVACTSVHPTIGIRCWLTHHEPDVQHWAVLPGTGSQGYRNVWWTDQAVKVS